MRDVNYNQGIYENWKEYAQEYGIEGISKESSDWIMKYLFDLEEGKNIGRGSRKGARSYVRLNAYRHGLTKWAKLLEKRGKKSIIDADADILHKIITELKNKYAQATLASISRDIKAFWNWYIRIKRKEGIEINGICDDLETAPPKTRFVYLTKDDLEKILPYLNYEEQLFTKFIFDSIARPGEALNIIVKDIYEKDGDVWLNIPDSIAKNGFGRLFNLLYTGDEILKYIKKNKLKPKDYLFFTLKKYKTEYIPKLKQAAAKVFGNKISHPKAQKTYPELEPYDLRHSGAIHLRVLAQRNNSISLDAIRQRGGWKDFTMLNYYTEFIGLTGEIKKEALLIEEDKTKLEKRVAQLEKIIKVLPQNPQTVNVEGQPVAISVSGTSYSDKFEPFST